MDHREAPAANERGNSNGVSMTKGGQRLALEDEERGEWLNAQVEGYRRQSRIRRLVMRIVRVKRRG